MTRDKSDDRLEAVEQFLSTLATREDLAAAIEPLATKADLQAAIEPLATKADLAEMSSTVRRHMDVVAESLREDIRLLAAGVVANQQRLDDERAARKRAARERADAALDRRVTASRQRAAHAPDSDSP